MLGAFKARAVAVQRQLSLRRRRARYLLGDSSTRAIVYHASFAPRLARVLPALPPMALLLQVDDGSGEPLLPGALDYEQALAAASDAPLAGRPSDDDLYIVYTGGTTGMPKGVLWRSDDIFFAAMGGASRASSGGERRGAGRRSAYGEMMRLLAAPPFMHAAGHWTSFIALHQGGTVVVPQNPRRLDPDDIWRTIERERVLTLPIVGDAFARPLIDQLRVAHYDLSSLRVIGSGAPSSRRRTSRRSSSSCPTS